MSVNAALVRFTYPSRMLGRAHGINAMVAAVAAAAGPTVGSAVLAIADWRWLFLVNVPIGIVAAVIAQFSLPYTERAKRSLNYVSVILHAATFGLLIAGLQSLVHDEARLGAALQIGAACAFGAVLVRREIRRQAPILPFDLMRIPIFSLSLADQHVLVLRADGGIRRVAIRDTATGLQRRGNRPPDDAVAGRHRVRGADRRAPGGPPSRGDSRWLRARCALRGIYAPGVVSRERNRVGPHVAHGPLRARLRLLPGAQQPHDHVLGSRARSGAAAGMLSTVRSLRHTSGAAIVAVIFSTPGKEAQDRADYRRGDGGDRRGVQLLEVAYNFRFRRGLRRAMSRIRHRRTRAIHFS